MQRHELYRSVTFINVIRFGVERSDFKKTLKSVVAVVRLLLMFTHCTDKFLDILLPVIRFVIILSSDILNVTCFVNNKLHQAVKTQFISFCKKLSHKVDERLDF